MTSHDPRLTLKHYEARLASQQRERVTRAAAILISVLTVLYFSAQLLRGAL